MRFVKYFSVVMVFLSVVVNAQFLPKNDQLSVESVQRWMDSNRDLNSVVDVLDEMYPTEDDIKKFDALTAGEQDQKITSFLQQKKLLETANRLAAAHGWKSVGEYMRLSTKLGNAIAAYFLAIETDKLSAENLKQVREKTDPAVLAVPANDIAFVKAHEKLLQKYIMAYGKGR